MEKGRLITVFNQDIAPAIYSEEQKLSSRRQDYVNYPIAIVFLSWKLLWRFLEKSETLSK